MGSGRLRLRDTGNRKWGYQGRNYWCWYLGIRLHYFHLRLCCWCESLHQGWIIMVNWHLWDLPGALLLWSCTLGELYIFVVGCCIWIFISYFADFGYIMIVYWKDSADILDLLICRSGFTTLGEGEGEQVCLYLIITIFLILILGEVSWGIIFFQRI